jgi:hypothetical protein
VVNSIKGCALVQQGQNSRITTIHTQQEIIDMRDNMRDMITNVYLMKLETDPYL